MPAVYLYFAHLYLCSTFVFALFDQVFAKVFADRSQIYLYLCSNFVFALFDQIFAKVFADRSQIYLAAPPLKADTRWAFTDRHTNQGSGRIKIFYNVAKVLLANYLKRKKGLYLIRLVKISPADKLGPLSISYILVISFPFQNYLERIEYLKDFRR